VNFRHLKEALQNHLPGPTAHEMLRATPVGKIIPKFEHKTPAKPGSVLILLYPQNNGVCFPLIKRPDYSGAHSGQVSFPGGKAEEGEDLIDTALREANEEIGIDRNQIEVLGKLSNFFVIPSNFIITPVVGVVHQPPLFIPDQREVAKILTGQLDDIVKEDAVRIKEIMAAGKYAMRAPHFEIEGEIVWGATAMILNELRMVLKEISH
jgi:8-oxo-dGTP pyrophosphatase MutT (NUDIX family)